MAELVAIDAAEQQKQADFGDLSISRLSQRVDTCADGDEHGGGASHLHTAPLDTLLMVCLAGGFAGGAVGSAFAYVPHGPIELLLSAEEYERRRRRLESLANEISEDDTWAPEAGAERTILTIIAICLIGTALSMLLVGAWTLRGKPLDGAANGAGTGAIWGLVLFVCLFLSPAYGLPPELPGMAVTSLDARQSWWGVTVLCTFAAAMLVALVGDDAAEDVTAATLCRPVTMLADACKLRPERELLLRRSVRWGIALLLVLAPHMVGAPFPKEEVEFSVPVELVAEFVARVPVVLIAFFGTTGAVAGWAFNAYGIFEYSAEVDGLLDSPEGVADEEAIWGPCCVRICSCGGRCCGNKAGN